MSYPTSSSPRPSGVSSSGQGGGGGGATSLSATSSIVVGSGGLSSGAPIGGGGGGGIGGGGGGGGSSSIVVGGGGGGSAAASILRGVQGPAESIASYEPDLEATMQVKSARQVLGKHLWDSRWVVLRQADLTVSIYREKKAIAADEVIPIDVVASVRQLDKKGGTRFDVALDGGRIVQLIAPDAEEAEKWVGALVRARQYHRREITRARILAATMAAHNAHERKVSQAPIDLGPVVLAKTMARGVIGAARLVGTAVVGVAGVVGVGPGGQKEHDPADDEEYEGYDENRIPEETAPPADYEGYLTRTDPGAYAGGKVDKHLGPESRYFVIREDTLSFFAESGAPLGFVSLEEVDAVGPDLEDPKRGFCLRMRTKDEVWTLRVPDDAEDGRAEAWMDAIRRASAAARSSASSTKKRELVKATPAPASSKGKPGAGKPDDGATSAEGGNTPMADGAADSSGLAEVDADIIIRQTKCCGMCVVM